MPRRGEGREARPRAGPPTARGSERGVRAFRGPGRRARRFGRAGRTGPDRQSSADAKFHVNAPVAASRVGWPAFDSRRRRRRSGWSGRGTGPARLAHGSRRRRSPSARGWRGRRCRRAAPGIWRRPGRIDRVVLGACAARDRGDRQRQSHERSAHRHWSHPRSVAPVFFETSATILAIAASISASVSVRSRGCRVTLIAIDFAPSGRPLP